MENKTHSTETKKKTSKPKDELSTQKTSVIAIAKKNN